MFGGGYQIRIQGPAGDRMAHFTEETEPFPKPPFTKMGAGLRET